MKTLNNSLLEIEGEIVRDAFAEKTKKTDSSIKNTTKQIIPKKKRKGRSINLVDKYKSLISEIQSLERQAHIILGQDKEMINEEARKAVIDQYSKLMSRFLVFIYTQPKIIEAIIGKKAWECLHDQFKYDCWLLQYCCYKIMTKNEWESYYRNVFLGALKKSGTSINDRLRMLEGFICYM